MNVFVYFKNKKNNIFQWNYIVDVCMYVRLLVGFNDFLSGVNLIFPRFSANFPDIGAHTDTTAALQLFSTGRML